MDYEPYDSSGTDDDLSPSQQNRISRGSGYITGNGRSAVTGFVPYQRMYGETDMEAQIHQPEQEAYISVLRAFKAQADAITWVVFCYQETLYCMICIYWVVMWAKNVLKFSCARRQVCSSKQPLRNS
ncbi:hypothetical protein P3S68_007945 [Capsicum galapagoense]